MAYTFDSSVLGRQRQRDLFELEANADYRVCSRTNRATQKKPVLENQEKKKGIIWSPHTPSAPPTPAFLSETTGRQAVWKAFTPTLSHPVV